AAAPPRSSLFPYTTLFRSFLGPSLGKGTRDVERPALVDDRDRPPPVADPRSIQLGRRGALPDLAGRVVLEATHLDELLPLMPRRSEEHTSELQSLAYLVCR